MYTPFLSQNSPEAMEQGLPRKINRAIVHGCRAQQKQDISLRTMGGWTRLHPMTWARGVEPAQGEALQMQAFHATCQSEDSCTGFLPIKRKGIVSVNSITTYDLFKASQSIYKTAMRGRNQRTAGRKPTPKKPTFFYPQKPEPIKKRRRAVPGRVGPSSWKPNFPAEGQRAHYN